MVAKENRKQQTQEPFSLSGCVCAKEDDFYGSGLRSELLEAPLSRFRAYSQVNLCGAGVPSLAERVAPHRPTRFEPICVSIPRERKVVANAIHDGACANVNAWSFCRRLFLFRDDH